MRYLTQHAFLIVGLTVLSYFISLDLENMTPRAIDIALVAVGFTAMAIYVVQSFFRVFRTFRDRNDRSKMNSHD